MPIFETLAAMTDWIDDEKFNFSPVSADARALLADIKQSGTKTVEQDITTSGTMEVQNETLTKGITPVSVTNNQNTVLDKFVIGIMNKTPYSTVEGQFENRVL